MPLPKKIPRSGGSSKSSDSEDLRIWANRYQLVKKLGTGNFGTAWLVKDLKAKEGDKDKLKVLKEIPVGDMEPDDTIGVMDEAKVLRNLDHPGIVKFFDSFIDKEYFCIVTEYCEGGDLDVKIIEYKKKKKEFPEAQVVEWLVQLLLAVQYMHDRRVMHRDLKTRNIFLRNNRIKLGDFGISRLMMSSSDMASTFVGTPYYMSPEVLKHEGYNAKSDVWSVGCIVYDLVALEHAFSGESLMGVMYKIVEGDLPEWPAQYSKDLRKVFKQIVVKDPTKRPSAAEALKLPFIAKQMQMIKDTFIEKHQSKGHKDNVNKDSQLLRQDFKQKKKLADVRKESEEKIWRNIPPRQRLRIEKQRKADEQARKLSAVTKRQHQETQKTYQKVQQKNNPYGTQVQLQWPATETAPARFADKFSDVKLSTRPQTTPGMVIDPGSDEEDEDEESSSSDEDDVFQTVREPTMRERERARFSKSLPVAGVYSKSPPPDNNSTFSPDDRPITPMKNTMIYDLQDSTLDFKHGPPDDPDLANTYYSQYDEFENGASGGEEEEEDGEGTLKSGGSDHGEFEALIMHMENALISDDTVVQENLADDTLTGAFGPATRNTKISNLRAEAERKLGRKGFAEVYRYLKEARGFNTPNRVQSCTVDEREIMRKLGTVVTSPSDCFLVEQLLFLEAQANPFDS